MQLSGSLLESELPLDGVKPVSLPLVDGANPGRRALDCGEIVGRDAFLGLERGGGNLVDITECLGDRLAGGNRCRQRFLGNNPAIALCSSGGGCEPFRFRGRAIECRIAGLSLGDEGGQPLRQQRQKRGDCSSAAPPARAGRLIRLHGVAATDRNRQARRRRLGSAGGGEGRLAHRPSSRSGVED